ncbi:MAG: hypothetical protein ACRDGQ_05095 [Candidatus Limnocylindrales bacterium]
MSRPRLRSRLAAAVVSGLVLAALAGPALPQVARAAGPGSARLTPLTDLGHAASTAAPASRGRIQAVRLVGPKPAAEPFSTPAVGRALDRVRTRADAARRAIVPLRPDLTLPAPPEPDPWQSSGAPAGDLVAPGVGGQQLAAGVEPADGSTAAGPDQVLEAVNGAVYFADQSGQLLGDQAVSTASFFKLPEPGNGAAFETFDGSPRVVYDAASGRWVASEVSWDCVTDSFPGDTATIGHGHIEFAISDGPNALGNWTLGTVTLNDVLPDQPTFALSTDKIAFTADASNMQAGGGSTDPGCVGGAPSGELLYVIDLAELAPGFNTWHSFGLIVGSPWVWLRPVLQEPASSADLRFVGAVSASSPLDVAYLVVTGSARANTLDGVTYDLSADGIVAPFLDPAAPSQPGPGTIAEAVDARPTAMVWRDGIAAIGSTYPCTPTGDTSERDCVRVISLSETSGYLEPTRLGDVLLGSSGLDQYQAALAFAGSGVLHAIYTASSSSLAPSAYAQFHRRADPFVAWSDAQLVVAGQAAYDGDRWGDYSMASPDPQDPNRVWVSPEYSLDSGQWATSFSSLAATHGAGLVALNPVRVVDSRLRIGLSGPLAALVPQVLHLPTSGTPSLVALTGNLTVTGATAAGFVTLSPDPGSTSSTINFAAGQTVANNVTVPIGPGGALTATLHAPAGSSVQVIFDVTGLYDESSTTGFWSISPVRVLDSRTGLGTGTFQANSARSFTVAGVQTIAADASAISANLTVTNATQAGYVAVTTEPTNSPTTSTLNVAAGDTRANGLTIPVGAGGSIAAVYKASGGTADLILDVTGYYSPDPGGLRFHPLNPGRYIDTRQPLGPQGYLNGLSGAQDGTPRSVQVNGHYGVALDARALTGNLTITDQTSAGYVTVSDVSQARPTTSTLNFGLGESRANGLNVPVDDLGRLWFVDRAGGGTVQLVFDLSGYFAAGPT